jgi:hypothetical protein
MPNQVIIRRIIANAVQSQHVQPPQKIRITENGITRITENGQTRITELSS